MNAAINFFELLDVEPSFIIDEKQLHHNYAEKMKTFAPKAISKDAEEEDVERENAMTLLEKGYQVLAHFNTRMEHLLHLHHMLDGDLGRLPPDFKKEEEEVEKSMVEITDNYHKSKLNLLKDKIKSMDALVDARMQPLLAKFDDGGIVEQMDVMDTVRDLFLKQKYLAEASEKLQKIEDHEENINVYRNPENDVPSV